MTDCHRCGTEKQLSKVRCIFQSPENMSNSELLFVQYHVSMYGKVGSTLLWPLALLFEKFVAPI